MKIISDACKILACAGLLAMISPATFGQDQPGQATEQELSGGAGPSAGQVENPGAAEFGAAGVEAAISTTLTVRSHSIGPGISAGNLEGNSCPAPQRMISGACHPFYNDRVTIINQFPNIPLNTWRCGFKNNTGFTVTVWIYTVCGQ
jgi:hypothetical protein